MYYIFISILIQYKIDQILKAQNLHFNYFSFIYLYYFKEVLDAHPGQHRLNVLGRRGFCRIALETGFILFNNQIFWTLLRTHLVPSYSFGENELFDQYPNPRGSRLRTIQVFALIYSVGHLQIIFKDTHQKTIWLLPSTDNGLRLLLRTFWTTSTP